MAEVSGETLKLLINILEEEEEVLDEIYHDDIKEMKDEVKFVLFFNNIYVRLFVKPESRPVSTNLKIARASFRQVEIHQNSAHYIIARFHTSHSSAFSRS